MANTVRVGTQVTGVGKASSDLDRLRDKFDKLQKQGAKGLAIGAGAAATVGAFNLVSAAIGRTTEILGESIEAALADEESVNRLTASLKANAPEWDGNTRAIEKNIEAAQRLGFEDETLRDSLTVLVGATHDVGKAQEIMATAMDLARFKGIDLRTASEALIKVEGGHYRALAQLGIKLKEGATSTDALAAVQKIATGQAEAYANTNRGKLLASQIALGEAMEDFGGTIMPAAVAIMVKAADTAREIAEEVTDLSEDIAALGAAAEQSDLGEFFEPLLEKWGEVGTFVRQLPWPLGPVGAPDWAGGGPGPYEPLIMDLERGKDGLHGLGNAGFRAAIGIGAGASSARRLKGQLYDVKRYAKDAEDALNDLADALIEHLYGDTIRAGEEADLKKRIQELAKELEHTANKRDALIIKGQLAETRGELLKLHMEMAEDEGPRALRDWFIKVGKSADKGDEKLEDFLSTARAMADLAGKLPKQAPLFFGAAWFKPGKQHGGPASGMTLVGEKGPEIVDLPSGSFVHSNPESQRMAATAGGWSGGGSIINLTVNVQAALGMTPAAARDIGDAVGPIMADYFYRRGLIARSA